MTDRERGRNILKLACAEEHWPALKNNHTESKEHRQQKVLRKRDGRERPRKAFFSVEIGWEISFGSWIEFYRKFLRNIEFYKIRIGFYKIWIGFYIL